MKTKIILLLVLLLIGLGDWSEHHFTCAAGEAQLLPISYTDEEIGRKEKKKPADTKIAEENNKPCKPRLRTRSLNRHIEIQINT